jgi:hypothetical protein
MSTNPDDLIARLLDSMSKTELMSQLPLKEAARIRGISTDTLVRDDKRRVARGERSRILNASERRRTMRLLDALCPDAE